MRISSAITLCRGAHDLQLWQKHKNGLPVPDDITATFHGVYLSCPAIIALKKAGRGQMEFRPTPSTRFGAERLRGCQSGGQCCEVERDGKRKQAEREESTQGYRREKASEGAMNDSCGIGAYEATWKPAERSGYDTFYGSPHCKYLLFRRSKNHRKTFAKHQSLGFS